jgi:hypothetical protein|tara:strand:- start:5209 stop:5862 length:654 start_codon:yes stop_codon:yes gene_type:complete
MIVIFNGPPASGKDEAATVFKERFGFGNLSFKYQLFKETINHFEVDERWFMDGYNNRAQKEKREFALNDMSRREAMIHVSENIIKPKKGLDYFGRSVADEIFEDNHYALADGGFVEELEPIVKKVGRENVIIVQLTREGCDYSTDSRKYFNGNLIKEYTVNMSTDIDKAYVLKEEMDVSTYRIHNNGSVTAFHSALENIYNDLKESHGLEATEPSDA